MSLILEVKVVPSSGKVRCQLEDGGLLKCYLKSPPEKGKANAELIALLSKAAGVPQQNIDIIAGATGRRKRISIKGDLVRSELLRALGIEEQLTIS